MTGKLRCPTTRWTRFIDTYRGGAVVYRIALWHPDFVTHLFSVCTPYWAPSKEYVSIETLVQSGKMPNLAYQLQLASGTVEEKIKSRDQIRQLLNGMYGGMSPDKERAFDVKDGIRFDLFPRLQQTKLVDGATLDYYADQYAKNGIHGTRETSLRFAEDWKLSKQ